MLAFAYHKEHDTKFFELILLKSLSKSSWDYFNLNLLKGQDKNFSSHVVLKIRSFLTRIDTIYVFPLDYANVCNI
jgi:hypothetical protein